MPNQPPNINHILRLSNKKRRGRVWLKENQTNTMPLSIRRGMTKQLIIEKKILSVEHVSFVLNGRRERKRERHWPTNILPDGGSPSTWSWRIFFFCFCFEEILGRTMNGWRPLYWYFLWRQSPNWPVLCNRYLSLFMLGTSLVMMVDHRTQSQGLEFKLCTIEKKLFFFRCSICD